MIIGFPNSQVFPYLVTGSQFQPNSHRKTAVLLDRSILQCISTLEMKIGSHSLARGIEYLQCGFGSRRLSLNLPKVLNLKGKSKLVLLMAQPTLRASPNVPRRKWINVSKGDLNMLLYCCAGEQCECCQISLSLLLRKCIVVRHFHGLRVSLHRLSCDM